MLSKLNVLENAVSKEIWLKMHQFIYPNVKLHGTSFASVESNTPIGEDVNYDVASKRAKSRTFLKLIRASIALCRKIWR